MKRTKSSRLQCNLKRYIEMERPGMRPNLDGLGRPGTKSGLAWNHCSVGQAWNQIWAGSASTPRPGTKTDLLPPGTKPGEARLWRKTGRRRRHEAAATSTDTLSSSLPHSLPCVMVLARVLAGAAVWFLRNARRWPRSECAVRPWVVGLLVVRL